VICLEPGTVFVKLWNTSNQSFALQICLDS
jgi:hypothetical protein